MGANISWKAQNSGNGPNNRRTKTFSATCFMDKKRKKKKCHPNIMFNSSNWRVILEGLHGILEPVCLRCKLSDSILFDKFISHF
jgi:hypothetical protein